VKEECGMAQFVDHKLKLTYEDLRQIPEDDPFRHEIIDGVHIASPSPTYGHQRMSKQLFIQLHRGIELVGFGEVVYAPMDTEIGPHDILEPDILVILNDNRGIIRPSHVVGAPDLVIEILSPSTEVRDRGVKVERYGVHGVPEYWIVDGDNEVVEVYRQIQGVRPALALASRHHEAVAYSPSGLGFEVVVDLTEVWKK
jgi:Uma2 family endonuclease